MGAINHDINSLKNMINTNAAEFKKDIQRIDKRLEENDAKTANLIEQALAKERENWANRMAVMEEKLANIENNIRPAESIPTEEATPEVVEEPGPSGVGAREQIPTMTFSNTTKSRYQRQGIPNGDFKRNKHPEILEEENKKPERFLNKTHEKKWELSDCKRKIIIKVTVDNFINEIEDKEHNMTEDYVFKNPINYDARITGIKTKIFNATGIPHHKLDIIRISISTKRAKLAWVTFGKAKTVADIFRLAVINGNASELNAFPHVPAKAMERRDGIEAILKSLQADNPQLRYQIRLGDEDLEIYLKNHKDYDYVPYRKVTIKMIDPNSEVPEWDLNCKIPEEPEENENGKRNAPESPEGRPASKKNIHSWQVSEFIWAYLEGTQTAPNYEDIDVETDDVEVETEEEEKNAEDVPVEEVEVTNSDDDLDN